MKSSKAVKTSKEPVIISPTINLFYLHHDKRPKIYFTARLKGSKRFYNLIGIPLIMMKSKRFYKTNSVAPRMDNGHPERAFFQKFESFGLGQTNWAEILGGILGISSQTIGTILAL